MSVAIGGSALARMWTLWFPRGLPGSVVLAVFLSGPATAADPLGCYLGGALGQGHAGADIGGFPGRGGPAAVVSDGFRASHFAFKVIAGLRPTSWLSAELSYMDFGDPRGSLFGYPARASMKGASAFGILYLPVRVIEVYAKAGIARIRSNVTGSYNPCPLCLCIPEVPCGALPFQVNRTNTSFAAGAGARFKLGAWAVRGEYERFNAAGEHPYLLTLGLTWSLL